ncbi:hypothetical protein F2Q69_00037973 [Brassica cretica]|uniref:Uncharacterized protein n=1 Tax=Brassica cretica TaxID=69181 RepID=A0A8S9SQ21_BRACR|nr:hypothetical protein F2Q69_00037973 [Brassica cretica]
MLSSEGIPLEVFKQNSLKRFILYLHLYAICILNRDTLRLPTSYCKSFSRRNSGKPAFGKKEINLRPSGASVMLPNFELRYETPDSTHATHL